MDPVFRSHTIICNWNRRGRVIVDALRAIGNRPILIVSPDIQEVINDIGNLPNVFVIPGDPCDHKVLYSADVPTAWSVIVLADDNLGLSADARSVQIALAVEKIQVSVHTVVELKDLRNKGHFKWTKVDELISDDELGAKMLAQGIRHILSPASSSTSKSSEALLLQLYQQLISPEEDVAQVYRVNTEFSKVKHLKFGDLLAAGLTKQILPLALCGYKEHRIAARPNQEAWTSWKTELRPNPDPQKTIGDYWPNWPGDDYRLGIVVFANSRAKANLLLEGCDLAGSAPTE